MFILHSSNKTENLLIHLTSVIENGPLSDPFSKEVFLIQSQAMERWLSQQLASHFGVWGNFEFLFPGKFFSSIAKSIDSQLNDDVFDREIMLWRFEQILRDLNEPCFTPLKLYLEGENKELKRFQLAQKLAQTFDQYQLMRSDMLACWSQGKSLYQLENEIWQRELWHRITELIGDQHRGQLWQDVINKFNQTTEGGYLDLLPERVFVFGLNTMPPLFLDYLQGLSRHCDIHLFFFNPTQVYWADLINKKFDEERSEGHPLLATLGQQGREFQQMILERADFAYEPASFEQTEAANNLQRLQNDILNNTLQTEATEMTQIKDDSISIHSCHSIMREVEVLKNLLLHSLEQNNQLELRDIVVMAPDIQLYAPFISATFSDIRHAIADQSLRYSNTTLNAFLGFLRVSQSRFGWQSVMDLLEQKVVYSKFSLSETDLELIKHWVADTHVRWGKSAEHKQQLGLPGLSQNTWQATLDRLLMGYAVGSEEEFVDDVLPYRDIEGTATLVLGGFNDFIQLLFKASTELNCATSLKNWGTKLYYYADQLLLSETPDEKLERQQLNELLLELIEKIATQHTQDISLDVILAWLENGVSERKSSTGFFRGQLTFCSMLPMRSIPFKVIALLGINEGEFPKIDSYSSFDLISQQFRKGDRSRRVDDRYQFLEILLSARQQLIITYIGQSIQQNDEIAPSVVISELLDVLENYYQQQEIIVKHPLQGFSQRYFSEDSELYSYSVADYETAIAITENKLDQQRWWQGKLETEISDIVDLNELFAFYRQPQKYFLQQKLNLRMNGIAAETEEREPFSLDSLAAYSINQQWLEQQINHQDYSLKKLQAKGLWLSGSPGELEFNRQSADIEQFTELIKQQALGQKIPDQAIDLTVGKYRLIGKLSNRYEQGSLIYRYANLKGKDFMHAWLHHLIINNYEANNTHLISQDELIVFSKDYEQSQALEQLIDIYQLGQQLPEAFFTEAAFAYTKQILKLENSKRTKKSPIFVAQEQLLIEIENDLSMQQLYLNVEDLTELLNPGFEAICQKLILPVWRAII